MWVYALVLLLSVSVQNVIIGSETGSKLQSEVIRPLYISQIVKWCLVAVGAVLMLTACLLIVVFTCRRQCCHLVNILCYFIDWSLSVFASQTLESSFFVLSFKGADTLHVAPHSTAKKIETCWIFSAMLHWQQPVIDSCHLIACWLIFIILSKHGRWAVGQSRKVSRVVVYNKFISI